MAADIECAGVDALFEPGILVVSGKGGTGKSTVAAALASAAARRGLSVLLAEVEDRDESTRTLGVKPGRDAERPTPAGFAVLSISAVDAAAEYLRRYHGMERLTRPLARAGAVEQVVRGAPGFRDLLVAGKIHELARAEQAYDLIVVDAPPTGQLGPFLAAPATFADLARVGPVKRRAAAVARTFRRRARVALVAVPEEMAVAETLESLPAVAAAGIPVVAIVANRCAPEVFGRGAVTAGRRIAAVDVRRIARAAGAEMGEDAAEAVLDQARAADRRQRNERPLLRELSAASPLVELPDVGDVLVEDRIGALASMLDPGRDKPATTHTRLRRRPAAVGSLSLEGDLASALGTARIVVVCGAGGVGKTTISAAIALHLAEASRRTALMTVDPARRLATALRLPPFPGGRTTVRLGRGRSMDAMQLDTKRTFDELVERYAGGPDRVERILSNPFYRRFADTLGGTHEYMAMEKLHQLAESEEHDAIVIDTPPTASALSFLDAPTRLTDFLNGRFLRLLLWPTATAGRFAFGAARIGARAFLRVAGRLVGADVLADTVEFLAAFEGMYGGFAARADAVLELLASPRCAFVVVAAPALPSLDEARLFLERTAERGMRTAAIVVNRWHPVAAMTPPEAVAAAGRLAEGDAEHRAVGDLLRFGVRVSERGQREAELLERAAQTWGDVPVVGVPDLAEDVHDVRGLRRVAARLFDPAG